MDITTLWKLEIQSLAQSGALSSAINQSFGIAADATGLQRALADLARGAEPGFPSITVVDPVHMNGLAGAYSPSTETIYLNAALIGHSDAGVEALTHEFAHYLLDKFFAESESGHDLTEFLSRLIGADQPLILSGSAHAGSHQAEIFLPGHEGPLAVEGFKTDLHIAWVKSKLPMLNDQGFRIIERAQEDTDAFLGVIDLNGAFGEKYSPYGLQVSSDSHFDQNNIRGGIETLRKRWAHGVDQFNVEWVNNYNNLLLRDKAYVGRDFAGQDAGVQNLLYRFGQISHALQDFYSHSNWLELSRVPGKNWIAANALLDSGLGLPRQLNPGDFIPNTQRVMVAMAGYDYSVALEKVGSSKFGLSPFSSAESVYWRVDDRQAAWGDVYATPLTDGPLAGLPVAGLMTGAVNEAVYYSTDYSVRLRAVGRTGFFEQEYFRGFSHGGGAGSFVGQWVRPLSKDTDNNERFTDTAANASLYEGARQLADLQLRNDWDRMGNLIFQKYGADGLRKFANYAVVKESQDLYVSTYSTPGARWNWDALAQVVKGPELLLAAAPPAAPVIGVSGEGEFRQIKVFFDLPGSDFNTLDNIQYLTQIKQDGRWVDSKAGIVGTHHEDADPEQLFSAAATQHQSATFLKPGAVPNLKPGGRALWSERLNTEADHLATLYTVENVNRQARVYINDFDIDHDELKIVDGNGLDVDFIDIDRADFEEVRKSILDKYNILINARPEHEPLSAERVLSKQNAAGPVVLKAGEFFDDSDFVIATPENATTLARSLRFASHDATQPWLKLTAAGDLQIDDLSAVAPGTYPIYVSVTDGAGLAEGALITLSIDPKVTIGGQNFSPSTAIRLDFPALSQAAVQIYSQVFDAQNRPVCELNQLAMSLGSRFGTPVGLEAAFAESSLADPTDHGTVRFFARFGDQAALVELSAQPAGLNAFRLMAGDQVIAHMALGAAPGAAGSATINELYVPSIDDMMLAVPLKHSTVAVDVADGDRPHQVSITMMMYREALIDSEFGFLLADLGTGQPINPQSGTVTESAFITVDNLASFSVFSASASRSQPVEKSASFLLDKDLNPDMLALLPYLKVGSGPSARLFFSSETSSPDGINHVARLNSQTFGCEDLVGGDYDFDDMVAVIKSLTLTDYY